MNVGILGTGDVGRALGKASHERAYVLWRVVHSAYGPVREIANCRISWTYDDLAFM